ncbi:hypothetical protein J2Z83_002890 [Virgibacillus natechei]|uniref:Bacteriophage abortive infection AbiH n=1 Tax=Virgibacillus natechei TaxID=1216297 RepID=A0ABS4III6_9BACI|nr:bacteriophage abortive infection AbiH family protein [Virgibacillus natechei]MBP1970754.1 hypothetical protein [Virgibacillus natechei]UZD12337.1 bacteriophage abortive infection AbiH family protein [Virgibacillus natechei]
MNKEPTTLFIIGNGFDLYHGVKSSYYEFRDFLKKRNKYINDDLEMYFECENFWGDFENNLAFLSREMLMESVDANLDIMMDTFDEEDDDFSYADYFAAIEYGTQIISDITDNLPYRFKQWIKTLKTLNGKEESCAEILNKDALYINFNYTEFLETLYSIASENILYIHGDRRERNNQIILGSGSDTDQNFVDWYRQHKTGIHRSDSLTYLHYFQSEDDQGNWKNPIRYYAADHAAGTIEGYFDDTRKKTEEVMAKHAKYFRRLKNVREIYVIGHSLAPVDHPYFKEIIRNHVASDQLKWNVSWYSEADKERINKFAEMMSIPKHNIKMFQLK